MNESDKVTTEELREELPAIDPTQKLTPMKYGPGRINIAIPDRGHAASLKAIEFYSADEMNKWAEDNGDKVIVFIGMRAAYVFCIYGTTLDENTREEMNLAAAYAKEKLNEFKQKKEEQDAKIKEAEQQAVREKEALVAIGKACAVHHGVVHEDFKNVSKLKSNRKSIADSLVRLFVESGVDVAKLEKLLKEYVRDGAS